MTSIFPNATDGGVVVRDANGAPVQVANTSNFYVPSADFVTNCEISYLPDVGCNTRITTSHINGIQGELLSLGECFNPTGMWDCNANNNLGRLFKEAIANLNPSVPASQLAVDTGINNTNFVTPETLENLEPRRAFYHRGVDAIIPNVITTKLTWDTGENNPDFGGFTAPGTFEFTKAGSYDINLNLDGLIQVAGPSTFFIFGNVSRNGVSLIRQGDIGSTPFNVAHAVSVGISMSGFTDAVPGDVLEAFVIMNTGNPNIFAQHSISGSIGSSFTILRRR